MKLTMTERDKNLVKIILIALIIFCSYYFGYRNISEMHENMKQERDDLTAKYKSLYPLYADREDYKDETEEYIEDYQNLLLQYPGGTTQEGMMVLAKSIEEDTGVWFNTFSMSDVTPIYTFGQITSSNPSNLGAGVYSTDYVGHKVTLTMNYTTTYEKGKKLIKYLNSRDDRKYTIDSINMQYSNTDDEMTGTLVLSTYDITGGDREFPVTNIQTVPIGSDNIFVSNNFYSGSDYNEAEGDGIINNYDIFMMVSAFSSDNDSVVVGLANDALGKTIASSSSNSVESVTITVSGKSGDYKVSYKVGSTTYPVENYFEGASFNAGNTIDLLIMSSQKNSAEDKAGAKINLINNTDKDLNVKIINDDADSPRVTIGTTTGSIKMYR